METSVNHLTSIISEATRMYSTNVPHVPGLGALHLALTQFAVHGPSADTSSKGAN